MPGTATPPSSQSCTETVDSVESGKDATRKLAAYAANLDYEALPPRLIELIKQCVLDILGVALAASSLAPEARIVVDYVKDIGGKPESSIWGFGGRAPAATAVLINGSLGHMLDYDDVANNGSGHVGVATIPVAFALAEKLGGMSGRDLITAIAAGSDVMVRLAESIDLADWPLTEGWFATQLFGCISGAATAGRLFRLDIDQMENAFGIGFNQMSGSRQMAVGAAAHVRGMQGGFGGQSATLAAELARRGLSGTKQAIEGRYGLFNTYVRTRTPKWDMLLDEFGTRFRFLDAHTFKVWPACNRNRATLAATLHLRQAHKIQPEDVESITVIGGTAGTQLLCEPLELKRRPQTSIAGKYSIPFTAAVMMIKGEVSIRAYTDEGLRDPAVLAMADRIRYDPTGQSTQRVSPPTVEIRLKDGRVLSHQAQGAPGDARNPLDRASRIAKFRDCVSFSANPVTAGNINRVIDQVENLENLADATEIIRLLAPHE